MRNSRVSPQQIIKGISIVVVASIVVCATLLFHNMDIHKAMGAVSSKQHPIVSSVVINDVSLSHHVTPSKPIDGIILPPSTQSSATTTTIPKITPHQIIQDQIEQIRIYFQQRAQDLDTLHLNDDEYNKRVALLRTEYDKEYLKYKTQLEELDQIQALIDAGLINSERGIQTMWKISLSAEVYRAMYPEH